MCFVYLKFYILVSNNVKTIRLNTFIFHFLSVAILYGAFVFIIKRFKIRFLDVSGSQYVILGMLLSFFLGDIGGSIKTQIEPMVWFCIGLIGFRYGLDFKFVDFGKNNPLGYKLALFDIVVTFSVIFGVLALIMIYIFHRDPFSEQSLLFILPVCVIGIVSSLSAIKNIHNDYLTDGSISGFALQTIQFQQIIALILFGIILLIFHKENPVFLLKLNSSGWTFVNLFLPIFIGFFYQVVLGLMEDEKSLKVLVFAFIAINTGVALILNFSPILFNLVSAIVLGNTSVYTDRIIGDIKHVYKTVVSIILIYAGYTIELITPISLVVLFLGYLVARLLGKTFGQSVALNFISETKSITHKISWLFMSQGRIAIVLAISFYHFFPSEWSMIVLTISFFSVVLFEFLGLKLYRDLLIDEEEIIVEESVT